MEFFKFKKIVVTSSFLLLFAYSEVLLAHGYTEHPKARQQFCVDDGGYWWPEDGSSIPNGACRNAYLESGTFQFVQNIEFAANVTDYHNLDAVKQAVPNGLLCAAGDRAKRGMDLPSADWQTTKIVPDQNREFELLFFGATPHNPSFWEFYLTKPGFNSDTDKVTWDSLELIDQKGDVPIVKIDGRNMYQMQVRLPAGRTGRAVLFTRWQRNDVAGEGFYNCSDIVIESDGTPAIWIDKGYFVKQGQEATSGDEVWFRLFDLSGKEIVFEKLTIDSTNTNLTIWAEQLASQIKLKHYGLTQIGLLETSGEIRYDTSNTLSNKVWVKNNEHTFTLDVKKSNANLPPTLTLAEHYQTNAGDAVTISASASDPENDPLTYSWQVPAPLVATDLNKSSLLIQGYTPQTSTDYSIGVTVSDGEHLVSANTRLTIVVQTSGCNQTDPDATNYPSWNSGQTYIAKDKVSYQQLVWEANWWNQNVEPSLTSQVWTLLSPVERSWQAGVDYAKGEEVNHGNRRWRAKWWTNGEPGISSAWEDIGPSSCLGSPN